MIRSLLIAFLLASPTEAGQFLSLIKEAAAATAPSPSPTPTPTPSGVCENCNGTGKLGDGTVSVPCPVCGGDGRLDSSPPAVEAFDPRTLPPDQQPTPMAGVAAGLNALGPLANKRLVVYGSGFDARWEITAARRDPTLTVVGIEIDPELAASARRYVAQAGLSDRVTILTGDAITTNIQADLGAAYLWPETLAALKPRIANLERFVCYGFAVPGLQMQSTKAANGGDVFAWQKTVAVPIVRTVKTGGIVRLPAGSYCEVCGGHCRNPMAHARAQQIVGYEQKPVAQSPVQRPAGRWVTQKVCVNGQCRMQTVWQPY